MGESKTLFIFSIRHQIVCCEGFSPPEASAVSQALQWGDRTDLRCILTCQAAYMATCFCLIVPGTSVTWVIWRLFNTDTNH